VLTPQDCASEAEIADFNHVAPFKVLRQRHWPLSPVEGLIRLWGLIRLTWRCRPDVILATGDRAVWLSAVWGKLAHIPWLAVAHGGVEFGMHVNWERAIARWAFSQPDVVVCVSEYTRQLMLSIGVRPARVEVIHNGADDQVFVAQPSQNSPALRHRLGLDAARLLLTVGSVTERKGQEVVIRALPYILKELPDVHYLMAGLPHIQTDLTGLARQLGVAERIHFLGRVGQDALVEALQACDLFVMTSRHSSDGDSEGYGIAVIEAALCGKPAVVSGESGLAEAVIQEQTGLLVPEDAPKETAQAIIRLLKDDALRQQMGRAAHQRASRECTWDRRVETYDALLRALATRRLTKGSMG
jgi:phosphatidylinositol alpha-1,6-mannosyltransferase